MSLPLRVCHECRGYIWIYSTKCSLCGIDLPPISTYSQSTTSHGKSVYHAKDNITQKAQESYQTNQEKDIGTGLVSKNQKSTSSNSEIRIKSSLFVPLSISFIAFIITFNIYKPNQELFRPMPSDPVAVRGYTKSNGEKVSAYHRKSPGYRGIPTPEQEVWFYQMKEEIKEYKSKRNDALIWSSIVSLFCFYVAYSLLSGK